MKFIYVMVLLSSMLFAMQKQIILGSYSVESNGVKAVNIAQEQIEKNEKLKKIMKEKSLGVMSTSISGYTVVSVNVFGSYTDLLPAMKVFKTYYGDAFVLKYPTLGFLGKESLQDIEEKAAAEAIVAEAVVEEVVQEVIEELQVDVVEEAVEVVSMQEKVNQVEEYNGDQEVSPPEVEKDIFTEYDSYFIAALAFLVLLLGAFIIYKKSDKEDDDKQS